MLLTAAILENAHVRLEPFEPRHEAGLAAAAHADVSIFKHMPYPIAEKGYGAWFETLREEQAAGRWIPHAVLAPFPPPQAGEVSRHSCGATIRPHNRYVRMSGGTEGEAATSPLRHHATRADTSPARGGGKIVGQSCYINPRPKDACVEIGATWYRREAQGTAINPAAKLLLLGHAFDCGAERIELKTDALNTQSRNAMLKLGCTFEGVMRKQMRRPDGSWRDNAWFSVVREDWPALKARIEARLGEIG